jgi:hypothetical protein
VVSPDDLCIADMAARLSRALDEPGG